MTEHTETWAQRTRPSPSEDLGHFLCIPTIRLREAAEALKQFDANFTEYGHKIPIIIFSDVDREAKDESGKPRWPDYDKDYADLQAVARSCSNDVYIVTPKDKEEFKKLLREQAADVTSTELDTLLNERLLPDEQEDEALRSKTKELFKEKGNIFDQMFTGSCGGNNNCLLLYTLGARIMKMDDDIRPYEIFHNIDSLTQEYDKTQHHIWSIAEKALPKGLSVYDALKDLDPRQAAHGRLSQDNRTILDISPQKNPFPAGSFDDAVFTTYDTAGAFFSPLGLTAPQLAAGVKKGDIFTTNDVDWRTNNPSRTVLSFMRTLPFFFEKYLPATFSHYSSSLIRPNRRGILIVSKTAIPRKKADAAIRLVGCGITGTFDDDPSAFMGIGNDSERISVIDQRSYFPFLAKRCLSIAGSVMGIDNRQGMPPNIKNLRVDDWGYRYKSLDSDTLTLQLPHCLTHIRSPERDNLLPGTYYEMLGNVVKALLLEGRDDATGTYTNLIERYTLQMADFLYSEGIGYGRAMYEQLSSGSTRYERSSSLNKKDGETFRRYCKLFKIPLVEMHTQSEAETGVGLEAFYQSSSAEINYEIELFRLMSDIWPELQEVVRQNRNRLPLQDLKTGEHVTMADITSPEHRREYSTTFTFKYMGKPLANSPPPLPPR